MVDMDANRPAPTLPCLASHAVYSSSVAGPSWRGTCSCRLYRPRTRSACLSPPAPSASRRPSSNFLHRGWTWGGTSKTVREGH